MQPASTLSRQLGLPTTPRPQKISDSTQNLLHNTPSGLPMASLTLSRPEHPSSSTSRHARSRSQPPRAISSPKHSRSVSTTARAYDENDVYDLVHRDRGQARTRSPPLATSSEIANSAGSGVLRDRRRSPAPSPPRNPSAKTPYRRHISRKATIDESSGDGYAIWNAVSNVAGALTVSVSKAWSSNIATFSGEETPPGQESRLTQAMKAYHIAKAQGPSDLPGWLFDERERRSIGVSGGLGDTPDDQVVSRPPQNSIRTNRTDTTMNEQLASASLSTTSTPSQSRLRGTDRLKAMRGAKRGIGEQDSSEEFRSDNQAYSLRDVPQPVARQPRIGLPSGPQRGRR